MNALGNSPTKKQIAVRAYEIYVLEGRPEGHDMEHWLQAEAELKEELRKMPARVLNAVSQESDRERISSARSRRNRGKANASAIPGNSSTQKDGMLHGDKKTGRTGERTNAAGNRGGIQEVAHRVMGSRQSERRPERSGQRRQPKRGHGSQRAAE